MKIIKICGRSLPVPLRIILEQSLNEDKFPENWENVNVFPVHKKEGKGLLKSFCPVCLLPILSKIFERVIYNSLLNYFQSNKLFTP